MSKTLPDKSWTLREIRESLLTYARGKLFAEWVAQQQEAWELVNNPLDAWIQRWGDDGADPKAVTDVSLYLDNWKYKLEVDDIHDSVESILEGADDAEPFWEPQKRLMLKDIDITDAKWLQPARIVKRDGRIVPFTLSSIIDAIRAATTASGADLTLLDLVSAATLASARLYEQAVANRMEYSWDPTQLYYIGPVADLETTVEDCQDEVERALIDLSFSEVAKAYILYRDARTRAREMKQEENKLVDELVNVSAEDNDEARENANVNSDATMGALLKVGETTLKSYALRNLISPKFAEMFKQGIIHIHDLALGCLTINCIFIPLAKLLRHGFSTGHGFLRPPATIGSAATQTCIVIQASQNDFLKHH